MQIVLLGGGGHAKVVMDCARAQGEHQVLGVLNKNGGPDDSGLPVLGSDSMLTTLASQGLQGAFVAVGDNHLRRRLFEFAASCGLELVNIIHPSAVIAPSVKLGRGIAVFANAVINPDSVVGDNVIVNTGATIDHDSDIAEDVHIAPGCNLAGNVRVGARTFLGIGCQVIPGIRVGQDVFAGAGTTIYRDLPDGSKVVGGGMRFLP